MSKRGRGGKCKKKRLLRELKRLKAYFTGQGVDITKIGISFDSWFLDNDFSEELKELGFEKQVFAAKSTTVLKVGKEKKRSSKHYEELELKKGWGNQKSLSSRLRGISPTFGTAAMIFFERKRTRVFALLCPARLLRQCEAREVVG
jgi:hypothetical protein